MKEQIDLLIKLQELDSTLDILHQKKGSLPKDIKQFNKALATLDTQQKTLQEEVSEQQEVATGHQEVKKQTEALIKKYRTQQIDAPNDRAYDSITQEIALQELDMKLAYKRLKTVQAIIKEKKEHISNIKEQIKSKKQMVASTEAKLTEITKSTSQEEDKINSLRPSLVQQINPTFYTIYQAMREDIGHALCVTKVAQHACHGCSIVVPLQVQSTIRESKKLVFCEHCGRILAKVEEVVAPEKPKKRRRVTARRSSTTKTVA